MDFESPASTSSATPATDVNYIGERGGVNLLRRFEGWRGIRYLNILLAEQRRFRRIPDSEPQKQGAHHRG